MRTTLKRMRLLARARDYQAAAIDAYDPESIEIAAAGVLRALELVDDLDDLDDQQLKEATG